MLIYRKCTSCKVDKPCTHQFFYKDKNRYLGLMYRCKECDKLRKDLRKNRYKNFTEEQKDKHKVLAKEYRKTKKGKSIFGAKAYQEFDKKKGLENNITQHDILKILDTPCTYCGFPSTGFDRINNNLGHILENCVPCCRECNTARMNNFTYEEMKVLGKAIREVKLLRT